MALGTLTIDIAANIAKLSSDLERANRLTQARMESISNHAKTAATALGAIGAGLAGNALLQGIRNVNKAAGEIQNLANLSNTSTQEFQKLAAGASLVGIEQDKLADIFKDTNDKVGDFLLTGGGELKDFFEQIAPKIGVTAEQFRNLSGPQALQLYYNSLQKAGLSQAEMVNRMEAIADEATGLIPLLRNNGKGFQEMAERAERLGVVLTGDAIKSAQIFNQQMGLMDLALGGIQNRMSAELSPAITDLANLFVSFAEDGESVRQVSESIGAALKLTASAAIYTAAPFVALGKAIGGFVAASKEALSGNLDAADEITRQFQADFAGAFTSAQERVDKLWNNGYKSDVKEVIDLNSTVVNGTFRVAQAATAAQKQSEASIKALLDGLKEQEATLGATDAQIIQYKLSTLGATDAQKVQAAALQETITNYENHKKSVEAATKAQEEFIARSASSDQSYWTEQERALAAYQERLGVIGEQEFYGVLTPDQAEAAKARAKDVFETAKNSTGQWAEFSKQAARNVQDSFAEFLFDPLGKSFKDTVAGFVEMLGKMAAQAAAAGILKSVFGGMAGSGGALGAFASAFTASANGNVFQGGSVKAFANGGAFTNSVVSSPTMAPMALFGEAGPEAIMPLTRGSDGSLGVKALMGNSGSGSISSDVTIVINSDGTVSETMQGDANQLGQTVKSLVLDTMQKQMRPGGMLWNMTNGRS